MPAGSRRVGPVAIGFVSKWSVVLLTEPCLRVTYLRYMVLRNEKSNEADMSSSVLVTTSKALVTRSDALVPSSEPSSVPTCSNMLSASSVMSSWSPFNRQDQLGCVHPETLATASHLAKVLQDGGVGRFLGRVTRTLLGTSASLLVTSALLVVTRTLVVTSATLVVTSALLVSSNKKLLGAPRR